jgi:hypothetical protein
MEGRRTRHFLAAPPGIVSLDVELELEREGAEKRMILERTNAVIPQY